MEELKIIIKCIKKFCSRRKDEEEFMSDYTLGMVRGLEMAIEILEENMEECN